MTHLEINFQQLFESSLGCYLILDKEFKIVAVTEAYLKATKTKRNEIMGKGLFEVFPDNPTDKSATGEKNLRQSLLTVLKTKKSDTMAIQKYDIRRPDSEGGGFEEKHWSPINYPLLDERGEISLLVHRVEDVTEFVLLKKTRN